MADDTLEIPLSLPSWRGWPDRETGPELMLEFDWTISIQSRRFVCVGVKVTTYGDTDHVPGWTGPLLGDNTQPLRARDWRRLNVAALIEDERHFMTQALLDRESAEEAGLPPEVAGLLALIFAPPTPRDGTRVADTLRDVAEIYNAAVANGLPPTKAVAEAYVITPSAARSRVARARDAGLLPKSPGRGRRTPRSRGEN